MHVSSSKILAFGDLSMEVFLVHASRFEREVPTFMEAEELTRQLVYKGKRVEILKDDLVMAKAREIDGLISWDIHPNGPRKERFNGGEAMAKWRLIGGGARRTFVGMEDKVKAIAEIYVKGRPPKDVLGPLYERAERELPKNTSIVMANWRKSIQDKLDKDDQFTINLCKTYGVIEEGEPDRRAPRKKK
jgi:hypothetical protein